VAPRRKSSIALRGSQARAGRIAKREQEERLILGRPEVRRFVANVRSEHATFASRCVTGEKLPRLLDGSVFDWDSDSFLSDARMIATKIVSATDYDWKATQDICKTFLERLDTGAANGIYIDPVGAISAQLAVEAFTPPDWKQWYLLLLDLTEYYSTKHADGSYFYSREEMNCERWLGKVFNQSAEVLELSNLTVR
jgi:hypothetical protein